MNFFDFPFWQSFVSNGIATLIGAGLGVLGALWLSNHLEKRTEAERKQKILKVLSDELNENSACLEFWKNTDFNFSKIYLVRQGILTLCVSLYTESWDAFSNGGELEWINDPVLLNMLATSYNRVSAIRYLANKYLDLAYSRDKVIDQETLEFIGKNLKDKVNSAITDLAFTEEYIEAVTKKSK